MRRHNPSREQLIKSADRRIRHLMIQCLENFENRFPDIEESHEGKLFKAQIRTAFNDVMRAQRDEIHDYDVEYRPLRVNADNTLSLTKTFFETVQKIDFSNRPSVIIQASSDHARVMDAIRREFGCGVLYRSEDETKIILEIVGTENCVNCVLPIMDKHRLHGGVRDRYQEWRKELVNLYRS